MPSTYTEAFKLSSEYIPVTQRLTSLAHLSLHLLFHSRLGFRVHNYQFRHIYISPGISHIPFEHSPHLPRHSHMQHVSDRATEPQRHHGIPQRLVRATKVVVYGTFCTLETLGAGRAGHEGDDGRCEVKQGHWAREEDHHRGFVGACDDV